MDHWLILAELSAGQCKTNYQATAEWWETRLSDCWQQSLENTKYRISEGKASLLAGQGEMLGCPGSLSVGLLGENNS